MSYSDRHFLQAMHLYELYCETAGIPVIDGRAGTALVWHEGRQVESDYTVSDVKVRDKTASFDIRLYGDYHDFMCTLVFDFVEHTATLQGTPTRRYQADFCPFAFQDDFEVFRTDEACFVPLQYST